MEDTSSGFRPPYMSFQTFWNFIEELASKPLPPRVDRSLMTSKSGTDQANLTMALTSFGLTDDDGKVMPELTSLVNMDAEQRKQMFGALVTKFYVGPLRVSAENGTSADLNKVFIDDYPGIASADTRRKAVTFFLHAARSAEIPLSPHFPATRAGSGAPGAPKAKRKAKTKPHDDVKVTTAHSDSSVQTQTVNLKSGGTVTLGYSMSLFDLDAADQKFVLDLVQMVKDYQTGRPASKGDKFRDEGGAS